MDNEKENCIMQCKHADQCEAKIKNRSENGSCLLLLNSIKEEKDDELNLDYFFDKLFNGSKILPTFFDIENKFPEDLEHYVENICESLNYDYNTEKIREHPRLFFNAAFYVGMVLYHNRLDETKDFFQSLQNNPDWQKGIYQMTEEELRDNIFEPDGDYELSFKINMITTFAVMAMNYFFSCKLNVYRERHFKHIIQVMFKMGVLYELSRECSDDFYEFSRLKQKLYHESNQ